MSFANRRKDKRMNAIKVYEDACRKADNSEITLGEFEKIIEPLMDVEPVISCKECKHWHREIHNGIEYFNFSSCDLNHCGDGHNFYCADAERKES